MELSLTDIMIGIAPVLCAEIQLNSESLPQKVLPVDFGVMIKFLQIDLSRQPGMGKRWPGKVGKQGLRAII